MQGIPPENAFVKERHIHSNSWRSLFVVDAHTCPSRVVKNPSACHSPSDPTIKRTIKTTARDNDNDKIEIQMQIKIKMKLKTRIEKIQRTTKIKMQMKMTK